MRQHGSCMRLRVYANNTRKEKTMRSLKAMAAAGMAILVFAGGCLPDNFWADKSAEIWNGIIIALVNMALAPTGIEI